MPELSIWQDTTLATFSSFRNQKDPDIVGLSNGNFLVVWADDNVERGAAYGYDIAGQLFGPDGSRLDGVSRPIFLNRDALNTGDEATPSVAATNDGGFVLTYLSNTREQVFLRFDAHGDEVAQNIDNPTRNTTNGNADSFSDYNVVFRPDGTSLISQREEPGFDAGNVVDEDPFASTYLTAVDAAGNLSAVNSLAESYDDEFDDIQMAVLTDGRTVIAYTAGFIRDDVYFAVVDVDDDMTDTFANTVSQAPGNGFAYTAAYVDVTALDDGGWVVSYLRDNVVYARSYAADGTANMDEAALVGGDTYKGSPQVIGLLNGGFALGWIDYAARTLSFQTFDTDGTALSDIVSLPFRTFTADDLQLSLTTDGRILVAWHESIGADNNVYRAILDPRDDSDIFVENGTPTSVPNFGVTVTGSAARDAFFGRDGQDTLIGKQAADELSGGRNNDVLMGGRGHDNLNGGAGDDSIFGGSGRDIIQGGRGEDTINGDSGRDAIIGGLEDDLIYGGAGHDTLRGDGGNDTIYGGKGNDYIRGEGTSWGGTTGANDTMFGGSGNDTIDGDTGQDVMTGGSGRDTFVFGGKDDSPVTEADIITDFDITEDRIDLRSIDAVSGQSGAQSFDYIGNRDFDAAGQVRVARDGDDRIVQFDRNGDGDADSAIVLQNVSGLSSDNFLL